MDSNKPSLNQITTLAMGLHNETEHFGIYTYEQLSDACHAMTLKQYKYALALWFSNKYFDLKKLIDQLLTKPKQA